MDCLQKLRRRTAPCSPERDVRLSVAMQQTPGALKEVPRFQDVLCQMYLCATNSFSLRRKDTRVLICAWKPLFSVISQIRSPPKPSSSASPLMGCIVLDLILFNLSSSQGLEKLTVRSAACIVVLCFPRDGAPEGVSSSLRRRFLGVCCYGVWCTCGRQELDFTDMLVSTFSSLCPCCSVLFAASSWWEVIDASVLLLRWISNCWCVHPLEGLEGFVHLNRNGLDKHSSTESGRPPAPCRRGL